MTMNILFVCTSNVCRSPMAEGFAKKWLSQKHGIGIQDLACAGFKVQSRGISTRYEAPGSPASAHGVSIMREHGVDIADHRSTLLSLTDVLEATHIYCVTPRHRDTVLNLQAESRCRLQQHHSEQHQGGVGGSTRSPDKCDIVNNTQKQAMISTFKPEIPDPWHGTMDRFRACAEMLEDAVNKALLEEEEHVKSSN